MRCWIVGIGRLAALLLTLATPALATSAVAQASTPVQPGPGYTDLADLVLASPVIVRAQVLGSARLSRRLAPDVPADEARHLVQAQLVEALKAPGLLPAGAEWLWQGPAKDFMPKGRELLAFLQPAGPSARPEVAAYRLVTARSQFPWSEALEARVRAILLDLATHGQAPRVQDVKSGFHVPGTVEGEAESQIFLTLADGRPITLSVLRRPGQPPSITIATGDVIAESAQPIRRETLLWRALACDLPRRAPANFAVDPGLLRDYEAVIESLGDCGRSAPAAQSQSRSVPPFRRREEQRPNQPFLPESITPTAPASG